MELTYTIIFALVASVLAYLIGSIPTARLIAKRHGVDITKEGSKNSGGTNVGRVIGKKAGITTMILDMFKCFIPCLIALLILTYCPMEIKEFPYRNELLCAFVGFFVAIGHSYPIYAKFKGGKCVACFAGYVLFVSPILFVLGASTFFIVFFIKKRVSLASLIGAPTTLGLSFVPMILDLTVLKDETTFNGGLYFVPSLMLHLSFVTTICMFLIVSLIVIRHRSNIKRLEKGTEPETHFKKN